MNTDEKIKILRGYCDGISHVEGQPIAEAKVVIDSSYFPNSGSYPLPYIMELLDHIYNLRYPDATIADKFLYDVLDSVGLIKGYTELQNEIDKRG